MHSFLWLSFPGGSEVKASTCNAEDLGSIPGAGRSPGEGNGNPLQYSCLGNSMDGGAWWATVHGVPKNWTRLSDFIFFFTHWLPFNFIYWEIMRVSAACEKKKLFFLKFSLRTRFILLNEKSVDGSGEMRRVALWTRCFHLKTSLPRISGIACRRREC